MNMTNVQTITLQYIYIKASSLREWLYIFLGSTSPDESQVIEFILCLSLIMKVPTVDCAMSIVYGTNLSPIGHEM